jgi:hypothetical protein
MDWPEMAQRLDRSRKDVDFSVPRWVPSKIAKLTVRSHAICSVSHSSCWLQLATEQIYGDGEAAGIGLLK